MKEGEAMTATMSVTSTTSSSISVSYSDDVFPGSDVSFYINGSLAGTSPATYAGTATNYTSSFTYSGLASSTTYSLTASDGASTSGTTSAGSGGSPPTGYTTVTPTAQTGHQFSVSWGSVAGASGYYLYKSSDGTNYYPWDYGNTGASDVGNVTSHSVPIDYEWQTYTFQVTPYNSYGNGPNSFSSGVKSLDETAPTCSGLSVGTITSSSVAVTASGYDNNPTSGSQSGLGQFYFYVDGNYVGSATQSGGSASYTFTGLVQGTTYTLGARAVDNGGNLSSQVTQSATTSTTVTRPSNFSWTTAKNSGSDFNLSASEWNGFTSRIDQFRAYKNLGAYGFTTVNIGDAFAAYMFNQAVNGISAMTPPTSPPSTQSTGNDIYASYLNDIVTSLNSIP